MGEIEAMVQRKLSVSPAEMASQSQTIMREILAAEKEAEEIIASAKKDRVNKLRMAKDQADADIKKLKNDLDAKFDKEHGHKARQDPGAASNASSQRELQMVHQDYNVNKEKTIAYICKKVMDVKVNLTSTQTQALKTGLV